MKLILKNVKNIIKERNFYLERIRLEFPDMPKSQIDAFDVFFNELNFEKIRKKTLVRDWAREKLNLRNLAEEQIISQIQSQIDSIAFERKRLETVYLLVF
jgi:hypothetical protein